MAPAAVAKIDPHWFSTGQLDSLKKLEGQTFAHEWQLAEALARRSGQWRFSPGDRQHNQDLKHKLAYLYRLLRISNVPPSPEADG